MFTEEAVDPNDPSSWLDWLSTFWTWVTSPAVSALGAVASIIGAGVAIWQAREASDSANRAERVLDATRDQKALIEVVKVHQATRKLIDRVAQIGPSSSPKKLIGLDPSDIARDIDTFIVDLCELRDRFAINERNEAQELIDNVRPLISALSNSTTPEEIKKAGESLHLLLSDFLPVSKTLSDQAQIEIPERIARN
jgi:hypothetical protein